MAKTQLGKVVFLPKEYELIEYIELQEETLSVVRTTKPNGDAYKLRSCIVTFRTPFKSSGYVNVAFSSSFNALGAYVRLNEVTEDRICYSQAEATLANGIWRITQRQYVYGYSTPNRTWNTQVLETVPSFMHLVKEADAAYIDQVNITGNKEWTMPVGTQITIYGIDKEE